jgi:uncharacterized protein YdhG (YjbR/CyaY superfamily)
LRWDALNSYRAKSVISMQSNTKTPEEYIESLPEDRKMAIKQLRNEIMSNLPKGFEEVMSYGMIGYVVPHSLYPDGYHCDPKLPLPFLNLASQKNYIALYHMGLYADPALLEWFTNEYAKHSGKKPDIGKSCIRFKNPNHIPYKLIGELVARITPQQWIEVYKGQIKK